MANIRSSKITPNYRWNVKTKRYIGPGSTGFVKNVDVRKAIDDYIEAKTKTVQDLATKLQNHEISLVDWEKAMEKSIRELHMANAAAAKGGWAQMDASAQGTAAQFIKQEYGGLKEWAKQSSTGKRGGLRQFALDIQNGLPLDGRFVARAKQYAQAGRHTYEIIRFNDAKAAGMTEARSIRHASDSCPGCIDQEDAGWQSIEKLVPIGERDCRRNCKCTVEYKIRLRK